MIAHLKYIRGPTTLTSLHKTTMAFQLKLQLQLQLDCAASNHLSVHQWVRSAIHNWQQPTSPFGFLSLKLQPPPCAVLLVTIRYIKKLHGSSWYIKAYWSILARKVSANNFNSILKTYINDQLSKNASKLPKAMPHMMPNSRLEFWGYQWMLWESRCEPFRRSANVSYIQHATEPTVLTVFPLPMRMHFSS